MLQTAFGASCMNWASVFEWHKRFKEGRESVVDDERYGRSKEVNTPELIGKGLRLLCWGFKGVHKGFLGKRPALFKSGQWHFHQENAPVHNSILVTDYLTKMGINTVPQPPNSPDLAPCDFCSLSSEAVVMRQLRRWRGCDEGHWYAHTRGLPWGIPEVVRTVQQVHCSRRRLLWRWL